MIARTDLRVGMPVSFRHKGIKWYGKITKINPKNVKVTTHSPHVTRYNVHPSFLNDETGSPIAPTPATVSPASLVVYFKGNVVKVPSIDASCLFVILGHRDGTYNVAKLGGEGGKYYNGIEAVQIEQVNFELAGV